MPHQKESKKNKETAKEYFNRARTWADDNFSQLQQSRNRYQLAFILAMLMGIATSVAVIILAQYQTLIPLLVHHYDNGIVTIEPMTNVNAPMNKTQVESDIARYVMNREAYDSSSYRAQFDLISLLSNGAVTSEYTHEQSKANKDAPINTLKNEFSREVHVYNIYFLDALNFNEKDLKKNHENLAEVVFTLTDRDRNGNERQVAHFNALIAWRYTKPSDSPAERWLNWDGFQVIRYSKQLRNV